MNGGVDGFQVAESGGGSTVAGLNSGVYFRPVHVQADARVSSNSGRKVNAPAHDFRSAQVSESFRDSRVRECGSSLTKMSTRSSVSIRPQEKRTPERFIRLKQGGCPSSVRRSLGSSVPDQGKSMTGQRQSMQGRICPNSVPGSSSHLQQQNSDGAGSVRVPGSSLQQQVGSGKRARVQGSAGQDVGLIRPGGLNYSEPGTSVQQQDCSRVSGQLNRRENAGLQSETDRNLRPDAGLDRTRGSSNSGRDQRSVSGRTDALVGSGSGQRGVRVSDPDRREHSFENVSDSDTNSRYANGYFTNNSNAQSFINNGRNIN